MTPLLFLLAGAPAALPHTADCGPLRLGFDEQGQWRSLVYRGAGELLGGPGGPDLEVYATGTPWPAEWQAGAPTVSKVADGWRVELVRRAGPWTATLDWHVLSARPWIERHARLRWQGDQPLTVTGARFRVPGVTLADPAAVWAIPGLYGGVEHQLADAVAGRTAQEVGWTWSETGCAYARSAKLALVASYRLEDDAAIVLTEEADHAVALAHHFHTHATLHPGESLALGGQWLALLPGDDWRRQAGAFNEAVNQGPPADRPAWLDGGVVMEMHPWGRLEAWGAGDRGLRLPSLEAQLPDLGDLGVDAVWLLPVGEKPPWVYHLPRFRQIDEQVTTPEQLKAFVAAAKPQGIRTLFDIVTYGIAPDSPDVAALPDEVWCLDEKGERVKAWSGTVLAANCSDPAWNAHILDLTRWWAGTFGNAGFRLDCGGASQALDWRQRADVRANRGMNAGGVGQNALIRKAIRQLNPDAVMLPEAGASIGFRSADVLHDYALHMACRELTREPDAGAWVARTRDWLADQQITHSPRMQHALLRFMENHDIVAAQDYYGVGPSHALTALCTFIPGVLMVYQEEEVGLAGELRSWLRLRHTLPELRRGEADYRAVTAGDPRVMAFLRRDGRRAAVVAISFAAEPVRCSPRWPGEPAAADALTGAAVRSGQSLAFAPYQVRVLRLGAAATPPPKPARVPAESTPPRTSDAGDGFTRYTIPLAGAAEWFVATGEGFLRDRFLDRHRAVKPGEKLVEATPTLWRCWRPLEQGLWDGGGPASIGAIWPDGHALEVRMERLDGVRLARLDDPTTLGREAAVVVESTGAQSPFLLKAHPDAGFLAELAAASAAHTTGPVTVDPLWVRIDNGHYRAALSRRHGGTLADLRTAAGGSWLTGMSEVYTDWGLFAKGQHVSTEGETSPRVDVRRDGAATVVTFRGLLHGPSWNGVQTAPVVGPGVAYRLTYRVDDSPVLRVELGATPLTDRADVNAFLAYRLPFGPVRSWRVDGGPSGKAGDKPGQRVYQPTQLDGVRITVEGGAGTLVLQSLQGARQPFLLGGGGSTLQWFFTLLQGGSERLPAGVERVAGFELLLK
ncbi:MAG: hypothetical protein HYU66_25725 [Armatimonadetes bacterium]|nr:hypothetical protein [Armatimonadota bacterium]